MLSKKAERLDEPSSSALWSLSMNWSRSRDTRVSDDCWSRTDKSAKSSEQRIRQVHGGGEKELSYRLSIW